jgi:S-DNA-T family DNA segregation ATPase FtsK/SpoIIIE
MNRTLDRQGMKEFENRILFQMSANDSSTLIDTPAASKLGENRALYYSEEENRIEKFRPYGVPERAWLEAVKQKFAARPRAEVNGHPAPDGNGTAPHVEPHPPVVSHVAADLPVDEPVEPPVEAL